jgi:hypothetical protein
MLPTPFIKYIPKLFRDNATAETTALCDKADTNIEAWLTDAINLQYLLDVERCPNNFLFSLGDYFAAGLKSQDSDRTKRQKIYKAIVTHKYRSTWVYSCKLIIDTITGYDAHIVYATDSDDWILCGDGVMEVGTSWALLYDGSIDPWGMSLIGDGTEIEVQGNIYIDCHYGVIGSTLTAAQIANIVAQISTDIVPAYMRIYLGYIDAGGIFVTYAGGTIT